MVEPAPDSPVASGRPLKRFVRVGPAEVAFLEAGAEPSPPVVLVHGLPTHSFLWRKVLELLAPDVHGLAPDLLGLGDTVVSPYQDFTAPFQAEILLEWLDLLGLDRVALVGHDHGGAVVQQIVANHPERVTGVVLVDSVCFDNWPVPLLQQVMRLARTPGVDTVAYALGLPRRIAHARVGLAARAVHDRSCMPPHVVDEYLRPLTTLEGRERARRFLLASDNRYTLECLPGLRRFRGPAAVVWGADDAFLSPSWGVRLASELPGADGRFRLVPFCGHLVPEERPDEVASAVRAVLDAPVAAPPGARPVTPSEASR